MVERLVLTQHCFRFRQQCLLGASSNVIFRLTQHLYLWLRCRRCFRSTFHEFVELVPVGEHVFNQRLGKLDRVLSIFSRGDEIHIVRCFVAYSPQRLRPIEQPVLNHSLFF
jgi:hypothetical protein